MFSEVFIIIVSWFSIIETCVRMIPPDEYYPTATLPDSPAIRKPVLVQPVMSRGSSAGAGGSPAATVPATNAPVTNPGTVPTATPGPSSLCTNCDINTIVPTSMATGTSYQVTLYNLRHKCSIGHIESLDIHGDKNKCYQAVTPNTGSYVVTDGGTENTAFTTMICANDRTWSYIGNGLSVYVQTTGYPEIQNG
ncbi:hypothetical protein CAEBREN_23117 [Caenorhabditis brenneri]|uniref:C6 domain-containing protein n=1 Tax=Caenorhabditis brenneri TaxID=135651 RepID=G0NT25_CAEBE|nr:hypothetical protein CAEBREN_23117 [Caenorhabditis brenneri]